MLTNNLSEKVQRILFGRPRLVDYLAYHYFFPTCFWGPFIEYDDFVEFVARRGKFKDIPSFFGRILMTIKYVVVLLPLLGALWFLGSSFMIEQNGDETFMNNLEVVERIGFYIISGTLGRFRLYYLVLILTQMALNVMGIGIREEKTQTQQLVHRENISANGWLAERELSPKRFFYVINHT